MNMPPGMRDTLAKLAAEDGRSMNAEIVYALASYTEFGAAKGEAAPILLSEVGLSQMSKRLLAGVNGLEQLLFDLRDLDLGAYIADQRHNDISLTRTEAVRKIVRAYLDERGLANRPNTEKENPPK